MTNYNCFAFDPTLDNCCSSLGLSTSCSIKNGVNTSCSFCKSYEQELKELERSAKRLEGHKMSGAASYNRALAKKLTVKRERVAKDILRLASETRSDVA